MRNLKRPDISVPAEQIFETCVSGYKGRSEEEKKANEKKRAQLLTCKEAVKRDSENYAEGIRQGNFEKTPILPKQLESELEQVYSDHFVKEPGRKYYLMIRGEMTYPRCPICGSRNSKKHLDHFLPKSVFPTLCVTPDNLIPICSYCNESKNTKYGLTQDSQVFHLYFDQFPTTTGDDGKLWQETFLYAKIDPDYRVVYSVECPTEWDEMLRHRIENLVDFYDLRRRFGESVDYEMAVVCNEWIDKVNREQLSYASQDEQYRVEKEVLQSILDGKIYHWRRTSNNWESALYRAMRTQIDTALIWCRQHRADVEAAEDYDLIG